MTVNSSQVINEYDIFINWEIIFLNNEYDIFINWEKCDLFNFYG